MTGLKDISIQLGLKGGGLMGFVGVTHSSSDFLDCFIPECLASGVRAEEECFGLTIVESH
jgi:hypothetical protein